MLIDLLVEGFQASWLPSSLLLIAPGIAALLAAQERFSNTWIGYAAAAGAVSWLRFTGIVGSWPLLGVALALAAAGVVLLAARVDTGRVVGSIGGMLAGAAGALLWQPLVGRHLGLLLVDLKGRGFPGAFNLVAYLLGVLWWLIAAAMVLGAQAWLGRKGPTRLSGMVGRVKMVQSWAGGSALAVLALIAALGANDAVASRLIEWSL
ncbi:MAG: hypothetical protein OEY41_16835 [Acidimicrobiia bacterium]|nr:hypothetical protein [Acidimicrobiia bacterium]MDH5291662.1 hypothetical protein [Acidimicrobiia bacterium]